MLITIFTPTYNRDKLLPRLYKSLQKQTCEDFEWVIVDDGSTDDTESICNNFINNKNSFPITYIKQKNGGKHRAINRGIKEAKGKLFFIADSDDMLLPNTIEIINQQYQPIKDDSSFGGICGLDCLLNGKIVGNGLSKDFIDSNSIDIRYKYKIDGDLKEVFYTHIMQEFPFPEIKDEQFVPEVVVWNRIAQKYKLRYINQPIYQVEYQENGLTSTIIKIRMQSPIASTICYGEMLDLKIPLKYRIRSAINYWRFYFCIDDKLKIRKRISPLWIMLSPVGWAFHIKDRISIKNK